MESETFDRIQRSLLKKRQHLTEWLDRTPPPEKQVHLGPEDPEAVHAHLEGLDSALEKATNKTLGLCAVCHDYVDTDLLEMDYTASVCIDHLSAEERERLEIELELSQRIQQALLPQQVPDIPGLELAAFSRPAQIVGGDYFDFVRFRDDSPGLVIADVAGKGMSASLLMASLQTFLRALVPEIDSPAEALGRLNRFFNHNIHYTTFVTSFLGRFDPSAHTLVYCNAGHNPPLLVHNQQIYWLQPTAAAIGLVAENHFKGETINLSPRDVLVLYTDGVTEAVNPLEEAFGPERLAELVRVNGSLAAKDLVRASRQALEAFTNGQPLADDVTIVVCKIQN